MTTNNANTLTPQEETHAARCTWIYVINNRDIYYNILHPSVRKAVAKIQNGEITAASDTILEVLTPYIDKAVKAAARMVRKYDHMTPTAADISLVTKNLIESQIEEVEYVLRNA